MTDQEKFAHFEQSIFNEVRAKAEKITQDANLKAKRIVNSAKREAERKKKNASNDGVKQIEKQYESTVASANLNLRRELMLKRKELCDALFEKIEQRLIAFTATDEYTAYLKKSLEIAKQYGKECTVLMRQEDIGKVKTHSDVKADASIKTGGIKILPSKEQIVIDLTLDEKLLDAKSKFVNNKSLIITQE